MGYYITHLVCKSQWQFGVIGCKLGVVFFDVVTDFTNDFKVTYYGILHYRGFQKGKLVHIFGITSMRSIACKICPK
jgi:hypothetical protein